MAQIVQGRGPEHSWPNSKPEKMGDEWEDAIHNGTDYGDRKSLMKKSLKDLVLESDPIKKGMRLSPILMEFVKSVHGMLQNTEESVVGHISKSLSETEDFNKSFAGSMTGVGRSFLELDERIQTLQEQGPATVRPVGREEYLRKSNFGGENAPSRKQVMEILHKGVENYDLPATEVIKYESTNELSQVAVEYVRKSLTA